MVAVKHRDADSAALRKAVAVSREDMMHDRLSLARANLIVRPIARSAEVLSGDKSRHALDIWINAEWVQIRKLKKLSN